MRIKKIHIQNYKSLVDFELNTPPPFCAFVGPNASGKSNIFEALEFSNYTFKTLEEAAYFFGGKKNILSYNAKPIIMPDEDPDMLFSYEFKDEIAIQYELSFAKPPSDEDLISLILTHDKYGNDINKDLIIVADLRNIKLRKEHIQRWVEKGNRYEYDYEQFIDNFSKIFIGNKHLIRHPLSSNKLLTDASNLPQIIGQIFQNEQKREDFIEWVRILIPEFENIEVKQSNIDGSFEFSVFEKNAKKPFPRHLLSDGTLNILALMAAVYQSSTPQFLCIEEPENGLHPQAIELLVDFFRAKCESEGHHIWLNTHSPTLVRCMNIDEVVLVNKIDGQTRAKIDFRKKDINLKTDEAWLTNALAGGVL